MAAFDLSPLFRQWIRFDELRQEPEKEDRYQAFPPYNIEKLDDNHYQIIVALAGFKQDELEIEQQGSHLTVCGTHTGKGESKHYLHQGLKKKSFQLRFTLADHMRTDNAQFSDGLLEIHLLREVPKEMLPLKIEIKHPQSATAKQSAAVDILGSGHRG